MIESRLDRGRGPVATVLVQKGTLQQGDIVVAGAEWGRVRAMLDDKGRADQGRRAVGAGRDPRPGRRAERRRAVRGGRERGPRARDQRVPPAQAARQDRRRRGRRRAARSTRCWPASRPASRRKSRVVIKADVQGSAEAIQATVLKLAHEEVKVRVLLAAVGQITESDVQLAKASDARDRRLQRARHRARRASWRSATASISATTRSSTRSRTTSRSWSAARSRRRRARSSWATPRSARCSTSPRSARSPAAW